LEDAAQEVRLVEARAARPTSWWVVVAAEAAVTLVVAAVVRPRAKVAAAAEKLVRHLGRAVAALLNTLVAAVALVSRRDTPVTTHPATRSVVAVAAVPLDPVLQRTSPWRRRSTQHPPVAAERVVVPGQAERVVVAAVAAGVVHCASRHPRASCSTHRGGSLPTVVLVAAAGPPLRPLRAVAAERVVSFTFQRPP